MTADGALPRPLRAVVTVVLCVLLAYAVVAMPLAMAGALRPLPALLLTAAATAGLLWLARGIAAPAGAVAGGPVRGAALAGVGAVVLTVVSAVVNAHFATEHVIADRDPGIYLWLGRWLADHGDLLVQSHSHLYANTGGFVDQCPATCAAPGGKLYVQFLHLLPATLAAGAWLGGSALLVKVNAILGGLSLLAVYAFATRIVHPLLALGAALALGLDFAQVYFARDAYSEILAQLFLFGGLFVLWDARAAWDPRRALLAGLLLGATCMARIDSFLYLIPVIAYVAGELILGGTRERRRFALVLAGGTALTAALGTVDLLAFSRGYYDHQKSELRAVGAGVALTLVGAAAAVALARFRPRIRELAVRTAARLAGAGGVLVAAFGLFAYLIRPHLGQVAGRFNHSLIYLQTQQGLPLEPKRTYGEQTMVWLSWYLGPIALVAGILGLAYATREVLRGRRPGLVPFAGIALVGTALYVARPSIFPNQVWAMRRFLPVTIPALLVAGAWGAQQLGAWLAPRRAALRWVVPAAAAAAAVAFPAWALRHVAGTHEQAGGLRAIGQVCRRLPPNAAIWITAGSGESRLLQPVHVFCDVPVAQSLPHQPPGNVTRLAARLAAEGRTLYVMSGKKRRLARVVRHPEAIGRPFVLHHEKLEESLNHRPRNEISRRLAVYITRP